MTWVTLAAPVMLFSACYSYPRYVSVVCIAVHVSIQVTAFPGSAPDLKRLSYPEFRIPGSLIHFFQSSR